MAALKFLRRLPTRASFDGGRCASYTGSSQDPIAGGQTMDAKEFIHNTVTENPIVLFMKGSAQAPQCGFSARAVQILQSCGVKSLITVNVLEDDEVRQSIKDYANWPTIPQLYVKGQFVGGADILTEMFQTGDLQSLLKENEVAHNSTH